MAMTPGNARRTRTITSLLAAAAVAAFLAVPALARQDAGSQQRQLESFIHFVIVGRGDLAAASANALFDSGITDEQLAELVDEGNLAARLDQALIAGRRLQGVEDLVGDMSVRVERGRFVLATDPDRIRDSVAMLTGTVRGRMMARDRLAEAGPYAVRPLLQVLVAGDDAVLVSEAEALLVQRIREGAVLPLSAALPILDPASQERVCFVLGGIGSPAAAASLPFLADLAASTSSDTTAARASEAISKIGGTAANPAGQFTALADRFFRLDEALVSLPAMQSLDGVDTLDVWNYGNFSGLEPVAVAKSIWFDVMAMRMAKRALELDSTDRRALAIFVAADLRRGLAMAAEGITDPIFGGNRYSPEFFATAAGPSIGQDVLALALEMRDTPLARKAIEVLAETAGSESLIRSGATQPILDSLGYPSRRVRIEAALAIAAAMPSTAFPGDYAVVPTLASAVRTDAVYAVVIAADSEERRQVAGSLANAGFTVLPGGGTYAEAEPGILDNVGVDLIVVRGTADAVDAVASAVRGNAMVNATPMVAMTTVINLSAVQDRLRDDLAAMAMVAGADEAVMVAEIRGFIEQVLGSAMDASEAREYAILALDALRNIAKAGSGALSINDAESALSEAFAVEQGALRVMIAEVLALIGTESAQQTLIDAALSASAADQVDLLDQAAASARRFGNRCHPSQASALIGLIQASTGDVADAAGRLYGALDLPVDETVRWILE